MRAAKILLESEEVNADKLDSDSRALLLHAALGGHAVVKMLLEREEVNPSKPDNGGRTPVSRTVPPQVVTKGW